LEHFTYFFSILRKSDYRSIAGAPCSLLFHQCHLKLFIHVFEMFWSKNIITRTMVSKFRSRLIFPSRKLYPGDEKSSFPRPTMLVSSSFRSLPRLISIISHLSRFGRRKAGHGRFGSACGSRASIRYEENSTRRSRDRVFLDQP
jgi:hypothetical protein